MSTYVVRRLLLLVPTVWAGVTLVFIIMRILPGDPARVILTGATEGARIEQRALEALRERMGLNRPLYVQYVDYMRGLVTLDLGRSLMTDREVWEYLASRIPLTLQVAFMATLITALVGVPIGILSAVRQDTWGDYLARFISILALSMPTFWVGIVMILLLVIFFNWLPPIQYTQLWVNPWANMQQLIWVALAVGLRQTAVVARMTRSTMLEVVREDYVRTARAKGLRERSVIWVHALRNAFIPVMTVLGVEMAVLVGGLVVTEKVFNVPGVGSALADSVFQLDYPVVQSILAMVVLFVVLVNLAVDLLYAALDPRVTYR